MKWLKYSKEIVAICELAMRFRVALQSSCWLLVVMFKGMGTPKGTWVRVQRVRVEVAILKPHQALTLTMG